MAAKAEVVQVSGRGTNVDFIIDDSEPFDQVTQGLRQYLVENRGLWSSGRISVNAGRWLQSQDHLDQIKQVIESESGLTVSRFWASPDRLDQPVPPIAPSYTDQPVSAAAPSYADPYIDALYARRTAAEPPAQFPPKPRRAKEQKSGNSSKGLPTQALFVKTTFRSGESVNHPGDVVVLSDVNPGAEILAGGDIVVFGKLRGLAHAGVGGDTKAAIIALELDAQQLRIGPYTGIKPAAGSKAKAAAKTGGPKIAYVRRRSIYVSSFTGRFARYSRGILYEG